jgi:hypothetical protein
MAKIINLVTEDEFILQAYYMGWEDCPDNDDSKSMAFGEDSILKTAYQVGWSDYIVGDDVSSSDLQTDEQILENIKLIHKLEL